MPRKPRKISNSGVYHVMIRGNEKKGIFSEEKDKNKIIRVLKSVSTDDAYNLYAYCIMNNHAHFVIEECNDDISNIMKRINTSYATYYNWKYNRVGHVFQDRFKSEPVEDESYLLQVIRYVHNNPVKAEIASKPEDYPWSSYSKYISSGEGHDDFPSVEQILEMFSKNPDMAIAKFVEFTRKNDNKEFLDIQDEEDKSGVISIIVDRYLRDNGISRETLRRNRDIRDNLLSILRAKHGFSIRSIEKETGINRNIIQRVSIEK
ncbi:MAG: transposase [Gudongella sp.]|nr:transposase [Gudongella sp.]